jgi:hypothetical protein
MAESDAARIAQLERQLDKLIRASYAVLKDANNSDL